MPLRTASTFLAALALIPAPARAATISYLAQERFVAIEERPSGAVQRVDAADLSDFDEALVGSDGASTVAQSSALRPDRIVAEVSQTASDDRNVESSFAVTFELDEASPFVLEGRLEDLAPIADQHEGFPLFEFQIELEASLVGPNGTVAAYAFDLQADCTLAPCSFATPFSVAGVLDPGSYTLVARSAATLPFVRTCFGFGCGGMIDLHSATDALVRVELRLVPEPRPVAAVAAGLVLLALGARRRRMEL